MAKPAWQTRHPPSALQASSIGAAVLHHRPSMVPPADESVGSGDGGIAEDFGVIDRIDALQAARDHVPAPTKIVAERPRRRSATDDNQGAGDCKHGECVS